MPSFPRAFASATLLALLILPVSSIFAATQSLDEKCAESIRQRWFSAGSDYRKVYDHFLSLYKFHRELRKQHADAQMPGKVYLDASGGTGLVAQAVLARFPDAIVHILDIEDPMLQVARDKKIENIRTHLCNLNEMKIDGEPIASNSIDGITWNNALYFFSPEEINLILREFYRILKPGGRLTIGSIRDMSPEERRAFKRRGTWELAKLMFTFRVSPRALVPVIQSTQKILLDSNDLTKVDGEVVAGWAEPIGFKTISLTNEAYGGMDFFIALEKPLDAN